MRFDPSGALLKLEAKRHKKAARWQRYIAKKPDEWHVWRSMVKRCTYRFNISYQYYGGRGIRVCARWTVHGKGFSNFMADMGLRPSPEHDLDRINPLGNYTPSNCRWLHRSINRSKKTDAA